MTKQTYLLLSLNPETLKPDIPNCAVFPNATEANKAKAFLGMSGMFVIVLELGLVGSKEEFCQQWEKRQVRAMLESVASGSLNSQS